MGIFSGLDKPILLCYSGLTTLNNLQGGKHRRRSEKTEMNVPDNGRNPTTETQTESSINTTPVRALAKDSKGSLQSKDGKEARIQPLPQDMLDAIEIFPKMLSAKFVELVKANGLSNEEVVDMFFPYVSNTYEVSKIKASVNFNTGKDGKKADMRDVKLITMVAMRLRWGVDLNALVDDCYDPPMT